MPLLPHTAIFTDNDSCKEDLARKLLEGHPPPPLSFLEGRSGEHFSNSRIASLLEEESRHDHSGLKAEGGRKLATFSSGERKKALLGFLLSRSPDFLILDNLFDNLDPHTREELKSGLQGVAERVILIQFVSRGGDLLPFIGKKARLDRTELKGFPDYEPPAGTPREAAPFAGALPPPPGSFELPPDSLVELAGVNLAYGDRPILKDITWKVRQGEFWELKGPNGSGKTSLIGMINGDNPKAYGQPVQLFGKRRGSGESIWEIKENIGYVTPALTDRFRGYHPAGHMLISGLTDSVGLYTVPTDGQRRLARAWLRLLGMEDLAQTPFRALTEGQQRLLMCARAMIKHPPLLILDEPTAGLDEAAASLVVALAGKMARESETALIFVSHREEPGLQADQILELVPGPDGSEGIVHRRARA